MWAPPGLVIAVPLVVYIRDIPFILVEGNEQYVQVHFHILHKSIFLYLALDPYLLIHLNTYRMEQWNFKIQLLNEWQVVTEKNLDFWTLSILQEF
jgi:hypothetical protein